MVVVAGPAAAMKVAVTTGLAQDVYPDERIKLLDTAVLQRHVVERRGRGLPAARASPARASPSASSTPAATRPSPTWPKRVKHNVTLVSAGVRQRGTRLLQHPRRARRQGPLLQHRPRQRPRHPRRRHHRRRLLVGRPTAARYGVAPGADLACFAIGQVLFTTAVVTAYDYMLDQPDLLGIDVINNSWGNSYRQFDPRDPVAVATKAVADQGVTVVFAAGNSGAENVSASLNPFSQSPWVISVAAGTLDRHRGDFSSNGLVYDNSQATGDRRRRAHDVHRRPDRPRPPRRDRARCRHLLDLRLDRHRGRPVPAGREHHRVRHLDGLAAHRRRRRRAQAGTARADPDPGAPGPRGHRDRGEGRRRHRDAAVLGGRPRLREPRQGRDPGPPQRLAHRARRRGQGRRLPGAGLRRAEGRSAATSGPTTPRVRPPEVRTRRPTPSRSSRRPRSCSSASPTPPPARSVPTCSATRSPSPTPRARSSVRRPSPPPRAPAPRPCSSTSAS